MMVGQMVIVVLENQVLVAKTMSVLVTVRGVSLRVLRKLSSHSCIGCHWATAVVLDEVIGIVGWRGMLVAMEGIAPKQNVVAIKITSSRTICMASRPRLFTSQIERATKMYEDEQWKVEIIFASRVTGAWTFSKALYETGQI